MNTLSTARLIALGLTLAAGMAQASTVSILNWTFGSAKKVKATGYSNDAGGLTASLSNAGSDNAGQLSTYAIEIGKDLPNSKGSSSYTVQDGSSYFQAQFNDAGIASRLGRLMTVVATTPSLVDTAAESASLQLAVWNLIYDTDYSVSSGKFKDTSIYASTANSLLSLTQKQSTSNYTLKVLQSSSMEDLFYTVPTVRSTGTLVSNQVAEPGSLALAGLTLLMAATAGARLRRRG